MLVGGNTGELAYITATRAEVELNRYEVGEVIQARNVHKGYGHWFLAVVIDTLVLEKELWYLLYNVEEVSPDDQNTFRKAEPEFTKESPPSGEGKWKNLL